MCADEEIGQHAGPLTAATAIGFEDLSGKEQRRPRHFHDDYISTDASMASSASIWVKWLEELRINHRVDRQPVAQRRQ